MGSHHFICKPSPPLPCGTLDSRGHDQEGRRLERHHSSEHTLDPEAHSSVRKIHNIVFRVCYRGPQATGHRLHPGSRLHICTGPGSFVLEARCCSVLLCSLFQRKASALVLLLAVPCPAALFPKPLLSLSCFLSFFSLSIQIPRSRLSHHL